MILTCPRCATRYLVDPHKVWTTGRTVQCKACGQRWRAVGEGERPAPPAEPHPAPAPVVAPPAEPDPIPVAVAVSPPAPAADPEPESAVPDASPPASPVEEPHVAPAMFRPPPTRRSSGFNAGGPALGRALAIGCLVIVAVTATVVFRDAIVRTYPGLAPVYASVGLLVETPTAARPHG